MNFEKTKKKKKKEKKKQEIKDITEAIRLVELASSLHASYWGATWVNKIK